MKSNLFTIIKKEFARFFGDKRMVLVALMPGFLIYVMYSFMGDGMSQMYETDDDYVYEVASLKSFAGKKLQKKRNHLNAFYKEYDGRWSYESITSQNAQECIEFLKKKAARAAAKYARRPEDYLEMVRQNALYRALMQKRAEKKAQKKKAPAKAAAPKPKQPEDKLNIEILLQMIAEIIDAFFEGSRKGLHIHVCRLHVRVVGKDAAQTALICGGLWAALSNLLAVLDAHARLRVSKADVSIVPDYTGEKTKTDFSLIISFGIVRTLHTLLSLLPIILKHKNSLFIKANPTQPTEQKQ